MAGKRSVEHISAIHLESIDQLVERAKELSPNIDADTLKKAYQFSEKAHEGQFRRSGDPYITHPLAVAGIIADLGLDIGEGAEEELDMAGEDMELPHVWKGGLKPLHS